MKIALLNTNDIIGGAAIVTLRLTEALRRCGADATMVVANRYGNADCVVQAGTPLGRKAAFLAERAQIFADNGFSRKDLFKVSTASFGVDVAKAKEVAEADAIVLNWVNQGFLSLPAIGRLAAEGRRIVWTMHDLWNLTGICHLPMGCERYRGECGHCPFLHWRGCASDLSHKVWQRKQRLYDRADIRFVAVSRWLAERCKASSLLGGRRVEVIPHAFPVEAYPIAPPQGFSLPGLNRTKRIIVMGAARLDTPEKGLDIAIDALNLLAEKHPDVAQTCQMAFFGAIKSPDALARLRFPHVYLGLLTSQADIASLYASAKVVLSTSLYETVGATLMEGMAAGAVAVSFGEGGQTDVVDHLSTGYVARYRDVADVADGLLWALDADIPRHRLHAAVASRFSSDVVALRYLQLLSD